jgi:hypothetical protein
MLSSCLLGAFAKLGKVTVSVVISVRPSVRLYVGMEQIGSHLTDFDEIIYLRLFFENLSRNFKFH